MEFLINLDDSLLDERTIYNFIKLMIADLMKTKNPNDLKICPHTVKVSKQLAYSFTSQQCQCISQNSKINEQIIRLLFYLLSIGLEKSQRIEIAKQNIENPKLLCHLEDELRTFQECFDYYRIYRNDDQILINLEKIVDFAEKNKFTNQISFNLVRFQRFTLQVVHTHLGLIMDSRNYYKSKVKGFQKLLQFMTRASQKDIKFEPLCIHNVNAGGFHDDEDDKSSQIQYVQITQTTCTKCNLDDLCASIGHLFKEMMNFNDSSSALLNSHNLQLIEKISEGKIRPLSFINELINPEQIDEVSERCLINEPFYEISPKCLIGREQVKLEIEFYKAYFIKKTQEIVLNFFINNDCLTEIKHIFFIFSLQLGIQLNKILGILPNPRSNTNLQHSEQLRNSVLGEIDKNNTELERLNRDYCSSQDQTIKRLIQFYPSNMNNFNVEQFRHKLLPNNLMENLDLKTQFRILCCLHIDKFFDYNVMLKNMKPYLQKTVYKYGIQVHEFEKFILNASDSSELKVIEEMIQILSTIEGQKPQK